MNLLLEDSALHQRTLDTFTDTEDELADDTRLKRDTSHERSRRVLFSQHHHETLATSTKEMFRQRIDGEKHFSTHFVREISAQWALAPR